MMIDNAQEETERGSGCTHVPCRMTRVQDTVALGKDSVIS